METYIIGNINARNQENEDASTLNRKSTEEKGWINFIKTKISKLDKAQNKEATKDSIIYKGTFDDELEMYEAVDRSLETDIIHNINTRN